MIEQKQLIELVKKIREEMGLGIMEIKAAVEEAGGDEKKAKEILKEQGYKKAEKRAEKETHQGRIETYTHSTGKVGVMVELLCETDFVAKNEEFIRVAHDICLQVAALDPKNEKKLLEGEFIKDSSVKVKDLIVGLTAKFGENIKLGRFARMEI